MHGESDGNDRTRCLGTSIIEAGDPTLLRMETRSERNWIRRTGQRWKLIVFFSLMTVAFAMLIIVIAQYNGRLTSFERFIDKVCLALTVNAFAEPALSAINGKIRWWFSWLKISHFVRDDRSATLPSFRAEARNLSLE
jgi:hypothetical protein